MKADLMFAARMALRDFRAGELRILLVALLLAVAALTSVSFFTDRVSRSVVSEANQLLGGDLLVASRDPLPDAYADEARSRGLRAVNTWSFTSMASSADGAQLVGVKVVSDGYPLRGKLRTAPALNAPDAETRSLPAPGTVWLDERATSALGVRTGDTLTLGQLTLQVAAVLTFESDRGASFFAIVPRLMLNAADLPASGLIQPGSRISYRLHLAGEDAAVRSYASWLKPKLTAGEKIETVDEAQPEVRGALDRAQKFLRLAAMLAVVFAAVAVGLSARRYMQRHLDGCAVMRCLGATQARLTRLFLIEFALVGIVACAAGCAVGYVTQFGVEALLAGLFVTKLPQPGALPLVYGFAVGMTLMLGFVWPQLLRLRRVSTLRVLRREWDETDRISWGAYGFGLACLSALIVLMAGDVTLGLVVVGGFVIACGVYAAVAWLALAAVARLRGGTAGGWRYGLASLTRRRAASVMQIAALGLGLTAVLLLVIVRGDLLDAWHNRLPADAPNRFILNIQTDQLAAVREEFARAGLTPPELLPMARARLAAINGKPASPDNYDSMRAQRLVEREFNLSWSDSFQVGNRIVDGAWRADQPGFSVEAGLAKELGLRVGDRLAFDIAGQRVESTIHSLRELAWDSMNVNFFVVASPGVLEDFPASYITSFHLPAASAGFTNALVARFPNLTAIDVDAVVRQFRALMDQLSAAVSVVFGFALLAGVVVLFAAIEATHDERRFELAVLRTLGARNRQLRASLLTEFALLGALAGMLAAAGAVVMTMVLAREAFQLPYVPSIAQPLGGMLFSTLAVVGAGMLGLRAALRAPALASLRAA
ncbi:ABC transporter permease [Methyloversatilis sp.]|uniref:ABC transporter permease n=1 Tax=Methyloversatilis sp. TaxID=2569862 RepID=UPI0027B8BFA1|nr:FtsX-like permease family protein [Methyloversatilis sp.]